MLFGWMPLAVAASAAASSAVCVSADAEASSAVCVAADAVAYPAAAASLEYANGVPPSSPGLRAPRYPGNPSPASTQPHRGCGLDLVCTTPPGGVREKVPAKSGSKAGSNKCGVCGPTKAGILSAGCPPLIPPGISK